MPPLPLPFPLRSFHVVASRLAASHAANVASSVARRSPLAGTASSQNASARATFPAWFTAALSLTPQHTQASQALTSLHIIALTNHFARSVMRPLEHTSKFPRLYQASAPSFWSQEMPHFPPRPLHHQQHSLTIASCLWPPASAASPSCQPKIKTLCLLERIWKESIMRLHGHPTT